MKLTVRLLLLMFDMVIKVSDKFFLGVFGVVLVLPSAAYANAGVPVIGTTAGFMIMLLIPIILIEAAILRKYLDIGYKKALGPSVRANLLSTIAGLPLAFVFTWALGEATQTSGWIVTEDISAAFLAIALQLLVAFFVSVYLEYLVVGKAFKQIEKVKIKQAVWRANEVTYSAFILFFLLPIFAMMPYRNFAFLGLILIASYVLLRFVPRKWGTVWHRRGIIAFMSLALLVSLLLTSGDLMVWASRKGDAGAVKMLIKAGAVVNAKGMDGYTPLMAASIEGHKEVASILINNGADVNAKWRSWGITPLMFASSAGHTDIVRLLIEQGADINSGGRMAKSPLYLASEEGHVEVVKLLLEKGANVNAQNNGESTALKVASDNGHTDIVKILKEAGAKE